MLVDIRRFVTWIRRRRLQARTWSNSGYDLRSFATELGNRLPNLITLRYVSRFIPVQCKKGFDASTFSRQSAAIEADFAFSPWRAACFVVQCIKDAIKCARN